MCVARASEKTTRAAPSSAGNSWCSRPQPDTGRSLLATARTFPADAAGGSEHSSSIALLHDPRPQTFQDGLAVRLGLGIFVVIEQTERVLVKLLECGPVALQK
jgi:hypothetical protein